MGKYQHEHDEFYHSRAWQELRLAALERDHWLCQSCLKAGKIRPASTVHHKRAVRDFPGLALDPSNLITLCPSCHNKMHDEKGRYRTRRAKKKKASRVPGAIIFKANKEL